MKRMNNLYDEILDFERVKNVFKLVKNNCRNKRDIYKFNLNLNQNIINILDLLEKEKYVFNHYRIFLITEPKYRLIMSECVEDKLVNHLISRYILYPSIEKSLIDTNVATRKNKGSQYAFDKIIKYINKLKKIDEEVYVLKIDIKKYFYNIDHKICLKLLSEKIKDEKVLNVMDQILDSTNNIYVNKEIKFVKEQEISRIKKLCITEKEKESKIKEISSIPLYNINKGLPIGNMTSQILAVFYLNNIDHFIKEQLKFKYYIRYMDDLIIFDTNKSRLKEDYVKIINKINEYNLEINRKSNLYRMSHGFSFLGYTYKLKDNKLIIRYKNTTIRRITRRLQKLKEHDYDKYLKSKASYKGFFIKSNTKFSEDIVLL